MINICGIHQSDHKVYHRTAWNIKTSSHNHYTVHVGVCGLCICCGYKGLIVQHLFYNN